MSGVDSVFIDSNIFIYLATEHPKYVDFCEAALSEIENGKKIGFTTPIVLNETVHKLMLLELSEKKKIPPKDAVLIAKKDPAAVRGIVKTWETLNNILAIKNLRILGTDIFTLVKGAELSKKYGLLISDAMHVATMQQYGIDKVLTCDRDFERVDGLEIINL